MVNTPNLLDTLPAQVVEAPAHTLVRLLTFDRSVNKRVRLGAYSMAIYLWNRLLQLNSILLEFLFFILDGAL